MKVSGWSSPRPQLYGFLCGSVGGASVAALTTTTNGHRVQAHVQTEQVEEEEESELQEMVGVSSIDCHAHREGLQAGIGGLHLLQHLGGTCDPR